MHILARRCPCLTDVFISDILSIVREKQKNAFCGIGLLRNLYSLLIIRKPKRVNYGVASDGVVPPDGVFAVFML